MTLIGTPKPPTRKQSRSPFIPKSRGISFSKLIPINKISTHRISSRTHNNTKNLTSNREIPHDISSSLLPPPQDFNFFITQLLDTFSSPEVLTDYFYTDRDESLLFDQFLDSCKALGLDQFFSNLASIFSEVSFDSFLSKTQFLNKTIEIQNAEVHLPIKKQKKPSSLMAIMKKILPKSFESTPSKTKKILNIIKNAKNEEDLIEKISAEVKSVNLTFDEIIMLLEYSKAQNRKKGKEGFNETLRVIISPFTLIPCTSAYNKKYL